MGITKTIILEFSGEDKKINLLVILGWVSLVSSPPLTFFDCLARFLAFSQYRILSKSYTLII